MSRLIYFVSEPAMFEKRRKEMASDFFLLSSRDTEPIMTIINLLQQSYTMDSITSVCSHHFSNSFSPQAVSH